MAYGKIVSINYDTPEQAATVAARINATEQRGTVRAYSNGRTLEITPSNPLLSDLLAVFSRIARKIAELFSRSEDNSSKAAVNA